MDTSILLQKQIKDNSEDLQNFMRDLKLWESDMKRKDKNLTGSSSENDVLPPVRRKVRKTETVPKQEVTKSTKKIPGHDYSSWDKFDVEKACEAVDNESSEENLDENCVDDVDDDIVKREQALYEKALGNRYVQDGKWDEAISAYSRAIAADPNDAVFFANRALCYLKKNKWDEVDADCSASIHLDSTYVKAYQRRAEGRKQLGKLEAAKEDLLTIIKLEPKNNQALNDLQKIEAKLKPAIVKKNSTTTEQTRSILTSNLKEKVPSIQTPTKKENVENCDSMDESEPSWSTKVCLVEPINKPPHLRSKKPLKRIPIKEINYVQSSKSIGGDQIQPIIENPSAIKHVDSVPNTSAMKETLIWNKEDSAGCDEELPPPPKTSVQFDLYWKKIRNSRSQCYQFLKQLRGEDLPVIFKESLECNIFSEIISVLASEFIAVGEPVLEYIEGFSKVRRFGALTLFMSLNDKSNLNKLFDHCKTLRECSEENIVRLKKLYEI